MQPIYVIYLAGGQGERMRASLPKQFHHIQNVPLWVYGTTAFKRVFSNANWVFVCPVAFQEHMQTSCMTHLNNVDQARIQFANAGETRFLSVHNALQKIRAQDGLVFVHDAVRPLLSEHLVKRLANALETQHAVVPVVPSVESLRRQENERWIATDRENIYCVQTPQAFHLSVLQNSYAEATHHHFTDDASVVEASGYAINVVEGETTNIKITYPKDMDYMIYLLSTQNVR